MVEKIIVVPEKVRGLGNIISPAKGTGDFECFSSSISSSTVSLDGVDTVVFGLSYQASATVSLTLSSSTVTVGTAVTLTATVLDDESSPIEGASVVFKVNGSQIGSPQSTNSSGVATYSYTTDTVGSLSVTAVYGSISSSASTLTVNKITSTISLSAASSTITYGSNAELSGTLSVGSGKSVTIYQGGSSIGTVTTGSGGAFSKTVSGLAVGTYSFTAGYAGDDTHTSVTSSAVSVTVSQEVTPSSISLTSDKSILSYADSQSASLTATVTGSDSQPFVGATVEIYKGTTKLGNATDNSDGTYSYTYASTGVGDISLTAKVGSLVSESYAIQDCWKYGIKSTDSFHNVRSPNVIDITDGVWSGYNKVLDFDWSISSDWQLECDFKKNAYRNGLIILDKTMTSSYDTSRYAFLWRNDSGNPQQCTLEAKNSGGTVVVNSAINKTMNYNQYYHIKIVKQGTSLKTYVDDVEVHSVTYVDVGITTANIGVYSWDNTTGYLKNLLIKPL